MISKRAGFLLNDMNKRIDELNAAKDNNYAKMPSREYSETEPKVAENQNSMAEQLINKAYQQKKQNQRELFVAEKTRNMEMEFSKILTRSRQRVRERSRS